MKPIIKLILFLLTLAILVFVGDILLTPYLPGPKWQIDWQVVDTSGNLLDGVSVDVVLYTSRGDRDRGIKPKKHTLNLETNNLGKFILSERAFEIVVDLSKKGYYKKHFKISTYKAEPEEVKNIIVRMLKRSPLPLPDSLDSLNIGNINLINLDIESTNADRHAFDFESLKKTDVNSPKTDMVLQVLDTCFKITFLNSNLGCHANYIEDYLWNWYCVAIEAPTLNEYSTELTLPYMDLTKNKGNVIFIKRKNDYVRALITCFWGGKILNKSSTGKRKLIFTVDLSFSIDRFFVLGSGSFDCYEESDIPQ
jgi:hypothetical protein